MNEIDDLFDLAARYGLQTSYFDVDGAKQTATHRRLIEVLRALGVPIESPADAAALLHEEARASWRHRLEPVVVAWDGRGSVVVRLAAAVASSAFRLRVHTEQGRPLCVNGQLADHPVVDDTELDGVAHVARRLPLPEGIPFGYHTLEVELGRATAAPESALLVCAPRRVHTPSDPTRERAWGVFMPLYALHTARSPGIGDFSDLRELIEWTYGLGGSVVGTLPLLAAFLDEPCEPSPYAPVSRLAWNELYLDPGALPEVRDVPSLRQQWESSTVRAEALRQGDFVDFKATMALKRTTIQAAAQQCFERGGGRRDELEAFRRSRPEIDAYARFRATAERERTPWTAWPMRMRRGDIRDGDFASTAYRHHLYAQWNTHLQLQELSTRARRAGLGLYLDLPVGVHPHGFDTWREPDAFVDGLATGAPPDTLFAGGQNWAFPPLHPARLRAGGYRHLIQVLRNHLRYAGVLRIDHVMGLHRLYVIPDGAPATEGVYIRYRPEELYAILSIESHRAKAVLIGENLGTVPPVVRHAMDAHGVHGMHVVQYAIRPDRKPALPPASPGDVASLNTHDMPPFHSFWNGYDIDQRRDLGWLDDARAAREHLERRRIRAALRGCLAEEIPLAPDADADETLRASLVHLGRGDARLVLATLEDLWGETRSQNVPGTYREHPNWCHRARHAFETWREMPEVTQSLRDVNRARHLPLSGLTVRHDVTRIGDDDVRAWAEGTHDRIYEVLGAHPMEIEGEQGTYFAVWAPAAEDVGVIGDFEGWEPARCPLRPHGRTGIWEGFVAGVQSGDHYEFRVTRRGRSTDKSDPVAFSSELPPGSASIVAQPDYAWDDTRWMRDREQGLHGARDRPMSIYEVHLGSWRRVPEENDRVLGYRELAELLADHVERLGFTHVELMPLMEHALDASWGYRPTGYFAPTSRYGTPRDLMAMVDRFHQRGIGVILDWVSSRFGTEDHGLARFDGTPLFERTRSTSDQGPDALVFDHGRPEVRSFLLSSACYWLETFHADGIRVEDVGAMPHDDGDEDGPRERSNAISFLRQLDATLERRFPGVLLVAGGSTSRPMDSRGARVGGRGLALRWDQKWIRDRLQYMSCDPIHRRRQHDVLTSPGLPHGEARVLALDHEAVAPGKASFIERMPGDAWQKRANLRLLYGLVWTQPGRKLLFMGQELGQWRSWVPEHSLDWHLLEEPAHRGLLQWVADLNRLYRREPAMHELDDHPEGLEWIDAHDADRSVLSYLRRGRHADPLVVVCNFTPVVRHAHRLGVPEGGTWYEILNGDAQVYGGSGVGNAGRVEALAEASHGRPHTLSLTLPPLGMLVLRRRPAEAS